MTEKSLINAQKVEFSYENESEKIQVLHGVDLEIKQGEFVAILGHNGSGKSTLAKHFNAMLLPSGGSVFVDGIDTNDENRRFDIRKTVGMVFQNPDNQLVSTIVEEDVAFGPENLGIEPHEIRRRVDEALKSVDMYEYRNHAPHKLSGGQKQRVAIAGIIAMQPQCIVYDEPTAMLDPKGRSEVMKTILKLKQSKKIAAVLITHYMEEAAMSDRVVVMDKGKILMQGKPSEIFPRVDTLRAHSLDVPQAVELAENLRKCGIEIPMDVLTPEDCAKAIYDKWRQKNARN